MYRDYSAQQWRDYLKLPADYVVDGVLVFGSNETYPYRLLEEVLSDMGQEYECRRLDSGYLNPIMEVKLASKNFWFFVAYGGAQLSEFLHLACSFDSRTNILLGNCGGLKKGVEAYDLIIPTYSYATESSAATYQPSVNNQFKSNMELSEALANKLAETQTIIHRGKMVTCQAMFGESYEHIDQWVADDYSGVEMEAATVFAVSNYFNVPAAAILKVIDNLAKHETIVENGYSSEEKSHELIAKEMFEVALRQLTVV